MTFADKVLSFNRNLTFKGKLPDNIRVMNPFRNNPSVELITSKFYKKYYDDNKPRRIILGINPGRFGAGSTGVPFTDTKRLNTKCGIKFTEFETHEPSSVFIYDMIESFGSVKKFYSKFYINSICPLGFTFMKNGSREVNHNYYDSKELIKASRKFIIESIKKQLEFGIERDVCFCMGLGKNSDFLIRLNEEEKFFEKIIPLEHPRFVIQYRMKRKQYYIDKYLEKFRSE